MVNDFGRKNLYRNNGDGTFTDVAPQAGVEDVGAGIGVGWLDSDNDGHEDLYVANMWTAAGVRVSMQDVFKNDSPQAVRALYQKHAMGNSLFRNRGETFDDVTDSSGVGIGRWSWSSDAFDFDHDGFPDLYITNGMVSGPSPTDLNTVGITLLLVGVTTFIEFTVIGSDPHRYCVVRWIKDTRHDIDELPLD